MHVAQNNHSPQHIWEPTICAIKAVLEAPVCSIYSGTIDIGK